MQLQMMITTIIVTFLTIACSNKMEQETAASIPIVQNNSAKVTAVDCAGNSGNYTLSVTIESPDTGCDQYADWWEVFRPDGSLVYRRILGHSHVDEQPFTRSGGPVAVAPDEEIIVRAHMNNLGYGTQIFRGNVRQGLVQDSLSVEVAADLANTEPLPDNCAF